MSDAYVTVIEAQPQTSHRATYYVGLLCLPAILAAGIGLLLVPSTLASVTGRSAAFLPAKLFSFLSASFPTLTTIARLALFIAVALNVYYLFTERVPRRTLAWMIGFTLLVSYCFAKVLTQL